MRARIALTIVALALPQAVAADVPAQAIVAAESEIAAGQVRQAAIERRLAVQSAQLAAEQRPIARLLAALVSVARRPAWVMLVQPGSVADLVHTQAVLAATLPVAQRRSAALRGALARSRALRDNAADAARRLAAGRARLIEAHERLAALDGGGDKALALAEEARETADQLHAIGDQQAVLGDAMALPGPPIAGPGASGGAHAYRLPVAGRLVTGLGEVSGDGVRARGLTFAVARGAPVVAPAAGRIGYAHAFRSYGRIVIIDHGGGWTTLITGLGRLAVAPGARVAAGDVLGRAGDAQPVLGRVGDAQAVTVELRRRGVAMDIAQLAG